MLKINLIVIGRLKEDYWTAAVKEYSKRLTRFCELTVTELAEQKTVALESQSIEKKLKGYVAVFAVEGRAVSSPEFAEMFAKKLTEGVSEFSLVIGGSDGVSEELKKKADTLISFGRVTYPHQLMRVIALEQIYRAMTINNNVTYHK